MPRPKGSKKTPGSGRKPGTPNKATATVKSAVLEAFERLGGADYLEQLGREDPKTFVPMMLKCIPNEVQGKIEHMLPTLVLSQDYVAGQVSESESEDEQG